MLRVIRVLAFASLCMGVSPGQADDRMFDPGAASRNASLALKWQDMQRRIADDEARVAACRAETWMCSDDERRLIAIADMGHARDGRARIGEVNRAVNLAIRPVSDERRFGVADQWSAPLETMSAGEGDCEDYAILKWLALKEAGIGGDDLRLVIVRERAVRSSHAILAVRLDGRWLLLDNRSFALVDLDQTHYRVLAALGPDAEKAQIVAIGVGSAPGVM